MAIFQSSWSCGSSYFSPIRIDTIKKTVTDIGEDAKQLEIKDNGTITIK